MSSQVAKELNTALCSKHTRFAIALCSPEQAAQLLPYNHHTVHINGRTGVLITYPCLTQAELTQPVELQVVFEHVTGHPAAPTEAQVIIDELTFETIS